MFSIFEVSYKSNFEIQTLKFICYWNIFCSIHWWQFTSRNLEIERPDFLHSWRLTPFCLSFASNTTVKPQNVCQYLHSTRSLSGSKLFPVREIEFHYMYCLKLSLLSMSLNIRWNFFSLEELLGRQRWESQWANSTEKSLRWRSQTKFSLEYEFQFSYG